jgi:hypothetical protein
MLGDKSMVMILNKKNNKTVDKAKCGDLSIKTG